MAVIVYVETNFLMSVALGREARGDDLLAAVSPGVRVVIPAGCYMESFSAFEDEEKRRNWFQGELDKQMSQLRRDITSPNANTLLAKLDESRAANELLLRDIRDRLFRFLERAAATLERISETPAILQNAVTDILIPDPTDNLILHSILDHARGCTADTKALLTDNTRDFNLPGVQAALTLAGINKHFRSVEAVLGWIGSL